MAPALETVEEGGAGGIESSQPTCAHTLAQQQVPTAGTVATMGVQGRPVEGSADAGGVGVSPAKVGGTHGKGSAADAAGAAAPGGAAAGSAPVVDESRGSQFNPIDHIFQVGMGVFV